MAARFWVNGGVDNNWSTIGNWSLTSGGAGGQTVPSALDDVTLNGAGNVPCTLNASARVCKSLTINGYTNTLTFDQQLSVSGSITFTTTGFSFAGATTNRLRMIAAGTWTTNGKTIPQNIEIGGTTTFTSTLATALTTSGDLFLTNTTSTIFAGSFALTATNATISGTQTITLPWDYTMTGTTTIADANVINGASLSWYTAGLTATGALSGTAIMYLTGGTWSGSANVSLDLSFYGNVTVSGTVSGTFVDYDHGTITTTGSTLMVPGSAAFNTGVGGAGGPILHWNNVTISAAATITLNSQLAVDGTLTLPNAAVTFVYGGTGSDLVVGTWTNTTITATRIVTFDVSMKVTINTSFVTVSAAAQTVRFTYKSSSAGNKVVFTLAPGATQDVGFADPTDLDSSRGQTIFSYKGVITTTFNWSNTLPVNVLANARIVTVASGTH